MKGINIKLYKKVKWYESAQKTGSLLMRSIVLRDVLPRQIGKICNFNFYFKNYKYVDQTHYFGYEDQMRIHKILKRKFISGISKRFALECKSRGRDLIRFGQKIAKVELKRLSRRELLKIFKEFVEKYGMSWAFVFDGYWSIEVLTKELMIQLYKISKNVEDDFINLTTDTHESHITRRQKKLLRIASSIYRNKILKMFFIKGPVSVIKKNLPPILYKKINAVYEEYRWMGTQFLLGKMLKVNDFIEEIKLMVERNPIKTIKKLEQNKKQVIWKFNQTKKRLKIRGQLLQLVKELKKASHQRTEELKYSLTGEYYFILFLKKVARRIDLTFSQIIYMTCDEIEDYLELNKMVGREFKKLISLRQKGYALLLLNGERYVLAGRKIDLIRERRGYDSTTKEIKGDIACKGRAVGRTKVVLNTNELDKVKKGDILITLMTTPDYIMAMQRSAAIITNDGGITCHAAIISRELNIPCIIGTKIATKVLKDGQMVEVDANKGVIRIIK